MQARILDNKLACFLQVLSYSSPLPCQGPKSNLHHLGKMTAGKHIGRANSEIAYLGWPLNFGLFQVFRSFLKDFQGLFGIFQGFFFQSLNTTKLFFLNAM